jgi:hypothetical protein
MYGYKVHELDSTREPNEPEVQLDSVRSFELKRVRALPKRVKPRV